VKKFATFVLTLVGAMACMVAPAFAAGLPAAHGADGRAFGEAVSGLAQTDPAALVAHILGSLGM
jgi:hypothetical protein